MIVAADEVAAERLIADGAEEVAEQGCTGRKLPKRELPPTGREFDVYRLVSVEGRTTREVAAAFSISQTRVVQLRNRVMEWMGRHVPPLPELTSEQRLKVAETLAFEQLQFLYEQAVGSWRASKGTEHSTRLVGTDPDDQVTIIRQSYGDVRYLAQAARISRAIAKQPAAWMPSPELDAEECGLGEGAFAAAPPRDVAPRTGTVQTASPEAVPQRAEARSPAAAHPPVVDCSNSGATASGAVSSSARPFAETRSQENALVASHARKIESPAGKSAQKQTVQAGPGGVERGVAGGGLAGGAGARAGTVQGPPRGR
jgi:hypothetical protein